ncbi:MAG: hypothetical protein ACRDRU_09060 [Pseudonocardiaceae bacterium]
MAHSGEIVGSGRNVVLAGLLAELGWPNSRVASAINAIVGEGYIARSTVSEWVNKSRLPREPLPTVVAHVLSNALGTTVSARQLWPQWVGRDPEWVPADIGTEVAWTTEGTRVLVQDWLANGGNMMDTDRRNFMAISGAAVTAPAWAYLNNIDTSTRPADTSAAVLGSTDRMAFTVSPAYVNVVEDTISGLRRMDDIEGGGGTSLRAAHREFSQVADLAHNARFTDTRTGQRFMAAFAQLCQSAGWMALDAQQHGLAWRYFRTGLQAAHQASDRDIGAHILGSMSYQAATRGNARDAVQLAQAATKTAQKCHPLVRAVVAGEYAYAQAAMRNHHGFSSAAAQMRTQFERTKTMGDDPKYLYWVDEHTMARHTGRGALLLALHLNGSTRTLSDEADKLLTPEVADHPDLRPRYACLYGAWLARLYVHSGDVEHAIDTATTALRRLQPVRSPMTITVLRNLDSDLATRQGTHIMPQVRQLRRELRPAITAS